MSELSGRMRHVSASAEAGSSSHSLRHSHEAVQSFTREQLECYHPPLRREDLRGDQLPVRSIEEGWPGISAVSLRRTISLTRRGVNRQDIKIHFVGSPACSLWETAKMNPQQLSYRGNIKSAFIVTGLQIERTRDEAVASHGPRLFGDADKNCPGCPTRLNKNCTRSCVTTTAAMQLQYPVWDWLPTLEVWVPGEKWISRLISAAKHEGVQKNLPKKNAAFKILIKKLVSHLVQKSERCVTALLEKWSLRFKKGAGMSRLNWLAIWTRPGSERSALGHHV